MSAGSRATERFDPDRHGVTAFDCGNATLNRWLTRYAGQGERRDAARTFVTTSPDGAVLGYYTLVAGQLRHEEATAAASSGQTRHFPIPIALLARLAVDGTTNAEAWEPPCFATRSPESRSPQPKSPYAPSLFTR